MKWTDFKWILKEWLSRFLDPFTTISKNLYKLFQKKNQKTQNLKPVWRAKPTGSRIWHFAQLQRNTSEWHRGSQIKRLLLYTFTDKPPIHIIRFLLDLKITALLSCGLRQRTALQARWQRQLALGEGWRAGGRGTYCWDVPLYYMELGEEVERNCTWVRKNNSQL